MKKIFSMLLFVGIMLMLTGCGVSKKFSTTDTGSFQYEIQGVNNGTQGTYLVKVWTYSSSPKVSVEKCKKNAVHGVMFKGYAGSGQVRPQNPLIKDPGAEAQHADYLARFFADGGEYNKYVTVTGGSQEVIKVGKNYQVGLVVSVSKDQLRKALEAAGIIKSLSHGF